MTLLRADSKFGDLLRTAAAELRVPDALVEKDEWLTQILRALEQGHDGQFEERVARMARVDEPSGLAKVDGLDAFVRVDCGVGGGSIPQEHVTITTSVGDLLQERGRPAATFEDLAEFRIPVLRPARTLVEKLCLVNGVEDCIRITRDHDGGESPVPEAGLADGPAFTDPKILEMVGRAYDKMLGVLALPNREHPNLDDVLARVEANAPRLRGASGH